MKWYGLCGHWGDHYRADHTVEAADDGNGGDGDDAGNVAVEVVDESGGDGDQPTPGNFYRLSEAGLI